MATASSHRQPSLPLFGREREQQVLTSCLDELESGQGQLVLIAGEPGIGKTRLAEETSHHARVRGYEVKWGHCFEWAGTPAYWPWVEILRELVEGRGPEQLRKSFGQDAALVAQVMPEIGEILPNLPPVPRMNPEQARFRLFDKVSRYLGLVGSVHPLVIVLDDLHWADPGSLLLLDFIGRELDDASLLILGTYRDVEVRREHPLASTLGSLARVRTTQRLSLSRLNRDHVADLIRQITGIDPPEHSIDDVFSETEGNPFFVTEVVRLLVDQQYFEHPVPSGNWNVAIPESVRETIGRNLDRLSERCNEVLRVASVIGREFDLSILQPLGDLSLDDLLVTLDEAIEARLVEERSRPGSYRFAHTLVQEALYEEVSTSRRYRLHGLVGETLEREHSNNLPPHYGDLARHFRQASFGANLEKAIDYAVKAGDQAMEQVAWESAVGHYQRAVDLLESRSPFDPVRVSETLLKLSEAQGRAGVSRGRSLGAGIDPVSRETSMRAAQIAREANLTELWAKALLANAGLNPWASASIETMQLMNEALCALPREDSALRARLLSRLSRVIYLHTVLHGTERVPGVPSFEESVKWSAEAIEMSRRLDDPAALSHALVMRPLFVTGPLEEIDEHLRITEEQLEAASRAGDQEFLFWGGGVKHCFLLQRGEIKAANELAEHQSSLGESLRLPLVEWALTVHQAGRALRTGRYNDADECIERANQLWPNSVVTNCQRFVLEREQDQVSGATKEIVESSSVPRMIRIPFALAYSLETEGADAARARLRDTVLRDFLEQPKTPGWIRGLTVISEVCAEVGDRESASLVYEMLQPFAYQNHNGEGPDDKSGGCVSYYLGLLATTLERWEDAARHFAVSLDLDRQWGYRPYVAYTQYSWADMILRRGDPEDRDRAWEMLAEAKASAREIGMVRLLRLIGELERREGLVPRLDRTKTCGLSPRELEVLRLLVDGKSDREIGEELFISHHTVMRHVSSILRKLDVDSRSAAAVYAVRNELV